MGGRRSGCFPAGDLQDGGGAVFKACGAETVSGTGTEAETFPRTIKSLGKGKGAKGMGRDDYSGGSTPETGRIKEIINEI